MVLTQYHPTCIRNFFLALFFVFVFPEQWGEMTVVVAALMWARLGSSHIPGLSRWSQQRILGWLLTGFTPWKSLSPTAWAGSPKWSAFNLYDFNDARKGRAERSGAGQDKWEEVGSGWEVEVKPSDKGRRAGNFLSLLIELKCSYIVAEILCWFQVLSCNALCSEDLGGISEFGFSFPPILVMKELHTGVMLLFFKADC